MPPTSPSKTWPSRESDNNSEVADITSPTPRLITESVEASRIGDRLDDMVLSASESPQFNSQPTQLQEALDRSRLLVDASLTSVSGNRSPGRTSDDDPASSSRQLTISSTQGAAKDFYIRDLMLLTSYVLKESYAVIIGIVDTANQSWMYWPQLSRPHHYIAAKLEHPYPVKVNLDVLPNK